MKPTRDDLLAVIRELADKAVPKVAQRNAAYAGSGDVFGNLNLVETLSNGRLSTELGITLRMGDKVSRLYSLCADPTIDPTDEPLEDTLIDLLGYSALLLLRHRTRTSPPIKEMDSRDCLRETISREEAPLTGEPPLAPSAQALVDCVKEKVERVREEMAPSWERHSYAWDGTIPCTGSYRCLFCKKVADVRGGAGADYSKVDYTERCPARTKCTNP